MPDDATDLEEVKNRQAALEQTQKAAREDNDAFRTYSLIHTQVLVELNYLKERQDGGWEILKDVVENATFQYMSMRDKGLQAQINAMQSDDGMPMWLSILITAGVTFIPISAIAGAFVAELTEGAQEILSRSRRRRLAQSAAKTKALALKEGRQLRGFDPARNKFIYSLPSDKTKAMHNISATERRKLKESISRSDKALVEYAKLFEPEFTNTLQDVAHALADTTGEAMFNAVKKQATPSKPQQATPPQYDTTDAPVVVVRQSVNLWINETQGAQNEVIQKERDDLTEVYALAVEPLSTGNKMTEKEREQFLDRRDTARRSMDIFQAVYFPIDPKTNKPRANRSPKARELKAGELKDLQFLIELMIWSKTFDFGIVIEEDTTIAMPVAAPMGDTVSAPVPGGVKPMPLPEGMWSQLLERYIDPDTGNPFKDSKNMTRLGTRDTPFASDLVTEAYRMPMWGPELRFSYFMRAVLAKKLAEEQRKIAEMLKRLPKRKANTPLVDERKRAADFHRNP